MSLLRQANEAAIAQVKAEKPQQFTVGGFISGDGITTTITYDRKWSNGWGATAYIRAWWDDLPVTPHPRLEAGGEISKRF